MHWPCVCVCWTSADLINSLRFQQLRCLIAGSANRKRPASARTNQGPSARRWLVETRAPALGRSEDSFLMVFLRM